MRLNFEGYYGWKAEKKETIDNDDAWKKNNVDYHTRFHSYFTDFTPIPVEDEYGKDIYFDTVLVYAYLDKYGREASSKVFVPMIKKETTLNVEPPHSFILSMDKAIRYCPIR
jgi:hypothetical protein